MYQGLATDVIKDLYSLSKKAGVHEGVSLEADISIGRYAWARLGFDYDYLEGGMHAEMATEKFEGWFGEMESVHGLDEPPDGWPTFYSAQDVASYDPGVVIMGNEIFNQDVPSDMKLHLGKAFMLDLESYAHGRWDGRLY